MSSTASTSKRPHSPSHNTNDDTFKSSANNPDISHNCKKNKTTKESPFCSVETVRIVASYEVVQEAWAHYRAYLESEEEADEEETADIDELYEIIHMLEGSVKTEIGEFDAQTLAVDVTTLPQFNLSVDSFDNYRSLVPALLSMIHLHIGNHLISQGFEDQQENNNSEDAKNDAESNPIVHLYKSMYYFPFNASTQSILANYNRMNKKDTHQSICDLYECASHNAKLMREWGISILSYDNSHYKDDVEMYKEWIELLFLDGMCGVEYIGEDEEEEQGEGGEGDTDKSNCETKDSNNEENSEEYSMSNVESVSSFMAALLNSTLGKYDKAMTHLRKFKVSHRIHPNVWSFSMSSVKNNQVKSDLYNVNGSSDLIFAPKIFRDHVLPQHLYEKMCDVFKPGSAYWRESNYQNRGYYSFFNDFNEKTISNPSNLIEDVVVNHLLPIVKQEIPEKAKDIVGFEWWTHSRPLSANLGHQLHFDTDEALLDQKKEVTHPFVSSVLYLTGNKDEHQTTAGSTIVFDQTPDSQNVASKAFVSHAHDNSYMIFPGNCLHGVLPCPGGNSKAEADSVERLTFMVGFWTRHVPDNIKEEKLYSPCGPLPPKTNYHSWVSEICHEYKNESIRKQIESRKMNGIIVPFVEPAWETFGGYEKKEKGCLEIPCTLDHRFFVDGAPHCFRDSLFKSDETF